MLSFKQFLVEKHWIQAYKIHSKLEKGMSNPMWRHKGKIAALMGGGIAAAFVSKDYPTAAINTAITAGVAANHVRDIVNIRKKLKQQDKGV